MCQYAFDRRGFSGQSFTQMSANFETHYLPVDNRAVDFGIYVTGYGRQTIPPNTVYPPRNHPLKYAFDFPRGRVLPEYTVVVISEAAEDGVFETRGKRSSVGRGSVFLLSPNVWHRYRPSPKSGWTEMWIAFNGKIAHSYFSRYSAIKPNVVYSPAAFGSVLLSARRLFSRLASDEREGTVMPKSWLDLLAFLSDLENAIGGGQSSRADDTAPPPSIVGEVRRTIWNWSHTRITVRDVAAKMRISTRTLYRRLAKTQFSISDEIDKCKISRAKDLLVSTNMPVKAIANQVGYGGADSMRRAFVRLTGVSPRVFKLSAARINA